MMTYKLAVLAVRPGGLFTVPEGWKLHSVIELRNGGHDVRVVLQEED